jgi:hypothetical protein
MKELDHCSFGSHPIEAQKNRGGFWPANERNLGRGVAWVALSHLVTISMMLTPVKVLAESTWLAGDHHIHSNNSVGWDETSNPPKPIAGGDAIYTIEKNALMAREFGLSWMVATDHGGPNHSKLSMDRTYPALLAARLAVPEVIQFMGLELNTPGADHSSIIMPKSPEEASQLAAYEYRFDSREAWPADPGRNEEARMIDALEFAKGLKPQPVVIAHHPSRSAADEGVFGLTTPAELRRWNDAAPNIAVGMEGAPGHQAAELRQADDRGGYPAWVYARGAYGRGFPTMGGFDQMTAIVGGFWDAMLGEGRRWWITANSDSHIHYTEGGIDFWPGEYSKTFVYAEKNHDAILESIRAGKMFVVTGGLITALDVTLSDGSSSVRLGEMLKTQRGSKLTLEIAVTDPDQMNPAGRNPSLNRVDLIMGVVSGRQPDVDVAQNSNTSVIERISRESFERSDRQYVIRTQLTAEADGYLRLRGTNTDSLEPEKDPLGEDPWSDLWFYSNPIFIELVD